MGCQKAITKAIVDAQADYVLNSSWFKPSLPLPQIGKLLRVSKNHETDFDQQTYSFSLENAQTNNHGRIESREHLPWKYQSI